MLAVELTRKSFTETHAIGTEFSFKGARVTGVEIDPKTGELFAPNVPNLLPGGPKTESGMRCTPNGEVFGCDVQQILNRENDEPGLGPFHG